MNLGKSQMAIVAITLPLVLASCAPKAEDLECSQPSPPKQDQTTMTQRSEPKTIAIQFDNTLSMQGFVKNTSSRYNQTLSLLADTVTRAFNESKPKYYSFNITRKQLSGVQAYKDAETPNFYQAQIPYAKLKTAITPFSDNPQDELSIIVTDLYQTDSSKDPSVLSILKENYIQKGKAVGILAVKSEFDGFVYDVGKFGQKTLYKTNSSITDSYHPFYVIVLGTYENIAHYFDKIKQDGKVFIQDAKFIIFYPPSVNQKIVFNFDSKQVLPEGMERLASINNGQVIVEAKNSNSIDMLKISKNYNAQKGIEYQINYSPLPYTLGIEPSFQPFKSLEFKPEQQSFVETSQSLQFGNWQVQDNTISFVTEVNSIKEPGVYKFAVDILANKLKYQGWWKEWNFGDEDNKFDGSKTYNLQPFLQGLSDITLQQLPSNYSIARICYAIQKE
ncbi:hypothetical protein MEO94_20135 [Dolichospermum sp. ST_sed9]|nr:hypothetical protein [Dolichospermum sp. ST_sed9]